MGTFKAHASAFGELACEEAGIMRGLWGGLAALTVTLVRAEPPFAGTLFVDPDIITDNDPTTYVSTSFVGRETRNMFDRRTNKFGIVNNVFLFDVKYSDMERTVEAQINPEFGTQTDALAEVSKYVGAIGQIPRVLRNDLKTLWVHKGYHAFGGGNENFLIHQEQGDEYIKDGILAEVFLHEGVHTSLDGRTYNDAAWGSAALSDPEFISTYARDNPQGEDVSESFPVWFAVRHRQSRISSENYKKITKAIPSRLKYFDAQCHNLGPQNGSNGTDPNGTDPNCGGDKNNAGRIWPSLTAGLAALLGVWRVEALAILTHTV